LERILIVDSNKTLAKLIAKKIGEALDFEIDIAFSLSEAKLFLHKYQYFVTVADSHLVDAPNGEVVDYILKKQQSVIVLSGQIDKKFRQSMLQKNIIDYVNKSGTGDIEYLIHTIQRLQKNQKHRVLVVDDSMMFRKQMVSFLENLFYKVTAVAHGEEALGMLQTYPDISLVLTDYNMPVMDGLELTRAIREEYSKNELSILALSGNNDDDVSALFLKNGANDFIKKPFSKEEFACRVNNSIEALENIQIITNQAQRDFLTGLYNRRYFFENMQSYIEKHNDDSFVVAMIDIDDFKKINDTYGHDVGDKAIIEVAEILTSGTNYHDLVARFGGEEFCVVLKDVDMEQSYRILDKLRENIQNNVIECEKYENISFTVSIGVALFDGEESLEEVINQADMNLYKAKQNGKNQIQS